MATAFGRSDFLDSLGDQGVVIIMEWLVSRQPLAIHR